MENTVIPQPSERTIDTILKESNWYVPHFSDRIFDSSGDFAAEDFEYNFLVFKNCTFKRKLILSDRKIGQGIMFNNCIFEGGLLIKDIHCDDANPFYNQRKTNVYINKCNISGQLFISGKYTRSIEVIKSNIEELLLYGIQCDREIVIRNNIITNLELSSCIIKHGWDVEDNKIQILYLGSVVSGRILFYQNEFTQFRNTGMEVKVEAGGVYTLAKNTIDQLTFSLSKFFNGTYVFDQNTIKKESSFTSYEYYSFDGPLAQLIRAESNCVPKFKNTDFYFKENIIDSSILFGENYAGLSFNKFLIRLSSASKGLIDISVVNATELIISGVINVSTLFVDLTRITNVLLLNFTNYNNAKVVNYDSVPGKSFRIRNSNLGRLHFSNCDFSGGETFEINNSNVSEIQYSNVNWFDEANLTLTELNRFSSKTDDPTLHNYNLYLVYSQFKKAADKMSDRGKVVHFRALENKHLYIRTKASVSFFNRERILMLLNSTNEFGMNWVRPIWLAIIGTLASYMLIILDHHIKFRNQQ